MEVINLPRLVKLCDGDRKAFLQKLREWGLIKLEGEYPCPKCRNDLKLYEMRDRVDGWQWRCKKKHRVEFRTKTFFEKSHLSLFQILGFVNMWVGKTSQQLICEQLEMHASVAVDWASFCREVVLNAMFDMKEKIGGPDKVVEIVESKFGKRKYCRGHRIEDQWVFGGFERGSGKVFMVAVEDRGQNTLLPIIKDWILPGSTIISDYWRAYDCLKNEEYEHLRVNHSLYYKDPESGVHIKNIEACWRPAKLACGGAGRKAAHIPGNLARYMFYRRCEARKENKTAQFYKMAGQMYDPTNPSMLPFKEEMESNEENESTLF